MRLLFDKPDVISRLTSGLLFILPFCKCVITALHAVLRRFPQNLQISTSEMSTTQIKFIQKLERSLHFGWLCGGVCMYVYLCGRISIHFSNFVPAVKMVRIAVYFNTKLQG